MLTGPSGQPLRIAVACSSDPRDRSALSGMAANFLDGLVELGVEAHPIWAHPDRRRLALSTARQAATFSRLLLTSRRRPSKDLARQSLRGSRFTDYAARERTAAVAAQLAGIGPVDGLVQLSSDFMPPPGVRFATMSDQTGVQAIRSGAYPHLSRLPRSHREHWIQRETDSFAAAVACCARSHVASRSMIDEYGVDAAKVHTVGIGTNRRFPGLGGRDWATPRFLFVGMDWQRKNGAAVVEAFRAVRAEHPGAELHLVGEHPAIDAPGVHRHGRLRLDDPAEREALEALYLQATCFVMPSRYEPVGIAYAEAAHAGIASIASVRGGAATVVTPSGLLIDPDHPEELVEAMRTMASAHEAARRGQLALESAEQFTWSAVAARVLMAMGLPHPAGTAALTEPAAAVEVPEASIDALFRLAQLRADARS